MKLFRVLLVLSTFLGAMGCLMADIPDPTLKLTIPTANSVDITCPETGCPSNGITGIDLGQIQGFTNVTPGPDFGTNDFGARNDTGMDIVKMIYHFQTDNIFQLFNALTNDFSSASINLRRFEDGSQGNVDVTYSGLGGHTAGSDSQQLECPFEFCDTTESGFTGHVLLDVFFVPDPGSPTTPDLGCANPEGCDGFKNGEDAGMFVSSNNVPEPGSFVLLLGAAGVLVLKRKLRRRTPDKQAA